MLLFLKNLIFDTFWLAIYFPIWWYGRGLKEAFTFCWKRIKSGWRGLALSILFENFFKPMYGQDGWDAYILSLFVRIWQISWRLILFITLFIFWVFVFVFWLILPPLVIWGII